MHPLIRQTVDLIEHHKIKIGKLHKRAGLNDTAFCHWRNGGNPTVQNFEAFLNAMGYHLEIVENVNTEEHQHGSAEDAQAVGLADPVFHRGSEAQPAHVAVDQRDNRRPQLDNRRLGSADRAKAA